MKFAWHEATQRRFCRILLLLFGILPFASLVLTALIIATPWYREYQRWGWEKRISDNLGVTVRADAFFITAPQQFHATGVEVRHPETGLVMARIDRVDGLMKSKGWSLILDAPVIDGSQVERGAQVLHDWFLCRPQTSSHLLAVAVPRGITIHHGTGSTKIERLELLLRPTQTKSLIQAKLHLEDQPFGEVTIQVTRDHAPDRTATNIEVSSPSAWLPCAAISNRFSVLKSLGGAARFRGEVHCNILPHQSDASLSGEFDRINWTSATAALGSPIRSHGALRMDQLNLRDGRILLASGEFHCNGGMASKSWLQRFSQQLAMPSHWDADAPESIGIDTISCRFLLDPSGLVVTGMLPGPSNWPPIAAKLQGATVCSESSLSNLNALVIALQPIPMPNQATGSIVDPSTAALSALLPWPNSSPIPAETSPTNSASRSRISKSLTERSVR